MTDTFLDQHTTRTLTSDLTIIATSSTELLRIARREVSPPGGRAARNPRTPGSRPPLNLGALSVANEVHDCLAGWARNLKADTNIPMPAHMDDTGLALHLKYHAHRIAQQPWAEDCASEINGWATTILAITTPPPEKKLEDYTPAQRREGMSIAKVDAPTCAELVAEWTNGDHTPTPDQIRTWGKRGHVTRFGPTGRSIYSPREVIDHMRRRKQA
ncbi:hypothetical protein [Dietzia sp. ANT_WB102]|uniref:DUF7341 domain-containing protein n=1 Tax=Dietzia sp. ANT_WB102 TaxID=2597345 RepID=UPI0011EC73DA|nr:hypothetical protein [Dietzia sp. ANT_WB102]KAA0916451.1 hypothetical protein FQ137_14600 [Dietzia sp. ANT_WB102]